MKKTSKPQTSPPSRPPVEPVARGPLADENEGLLSNRSRMFGQRREATLLFADLRRFTDLAAPLAQEAVYELLGHVMDCLTTEVIEQQGTVIDYFGDGLAAMWNAPDDQSDHAERACRAALSMIQSLPDVYADWAGLLEGAKLRLGIGVHTGTVQVGNAGSQQVKKYGPRGAAVHVASRVEAATKKIGVPLVLTGSTAARLSGCFATYRICRAELPGIDKPVDLYAMRSASADVVQIAAIEVYGRALEMLERGELEPAAAVLATLRQTDDPPTRFLSEYIKQQLGQQQGRRNGDKQEGRFRGVIQLNVK
ncbi:MAG: adenylate/guanylate cyclase domain-containing protein [Pirellulales bacterium]